MKCIECGTDIQQNAGTEKNPLCQPCFERIAAQHSASQSTREQRSPSPMTRKRRRNILPIVVVLALPIVLFACYSALGVFVVQPIGALPDGATVLYFRLSTNMPFISSVDGLLRDRAGGVSLLGRGLALAKAAALLENRKIVSLPYIHALYLLTTGGTEYSSHSLLDTEAPSHADVGASEVPVANFSILSTKGVWEYGTLRVKGEVKNTGSVPAGPQLEVIVRNANGELVDSDRFWPNSVSNISPGGTCGISMAVTNDRTAKSFEVKVISARTW
jgi:hypothetical protein